MGDLKLLICDDHADVRKNLQEKLLHYQFVRNVDFEISEFASGEELIAAIPDEPAVVFLDIELGGMNGIQTGKEIRKISDNVTIVLLTAYREYVFEGYKINAFRYLLKPIVMEELMETLDSIRKMMSREEDVLSIAFGREQYLIPFRDIMFVEVIGGKLLVHCEKNVYQSIGTLEELEAKLSDRRFFKVHRSFLINIARIKHFDNQNIYFVNGESTPVSRLKLQDFKRAYLNYWKDHV